MNSPSWLEGLRSSDRWRGLLVNRAPGVLVGVLALALAGQAALVVSDLAGGDSAGPAPLRPWHPHASAPDVAGILAAHLFGIAPQGAEPLTGDAPQTRLPLVLTGVIAGSTPERGLAILGPSPQSARVYAVGDSIPGGATLAAVLSRKVLLRQHGTLRSLALPQQSLAAGPPPSAAALPPEETSAPQFAARMRALVQKRPGMLAELLRPEPVFSGGHTLGYRVYPGSNPAAFARLGLQPGDLVLAINGTPLTDPSQDQQIFNTLGSSSEATVTVLRNGTRHVLTLDLAQVEQAAQTLTTAPPGAPSAPAGAPVVPFGSPHRPSTPPR